MTPLEDRIRAAIRAKADEIRTGAPPLRLPARRRRSLFLAYGGGEKKGPPARRAWQCWLAPVASAVLVAAVLAASAITFGGSRFGSSSPARSPAARAILPTSPASYLGVYAAGPPLGYAPIADFAKAAGKQPNLVGYFSTWLEPFAASYAQTIRKHGAVMIVQIDPVSASIAGIAAGHYDGYLRSYADSVRHFGYPVIIGFGYEMNFPSHRWGYGRVPASTFVAAWRHIVMLFRGQGADNVTWLWTITPGLPGTAPVASWWPGARYVTWVGINGYYHTPSDTFTRVLGRTIEQVRAFTSKPVLLSATAIGPRAGQPVKIASLFMGMRKYRTLGLMWTNKAQPGAVTNKDWRIEDNPAAEAAFRLAAAPLTLAHP